MSKPIVPVRKENIKQRDRAIANYYAAPNYCLNCKKIIMVRPHEMACHVKLKKFCDTKCSYQYNKPKRPKLPKKPRFCTICKAEIEGKGKFCNNCREARRKYPPIDNQTKDSVFSSRSSWQAARTAIRKHAINVYENSGKPKICRVCGYSKHVEISHKRPVSDFPDTALISEINNIENLEALCPTHHWEHENGLLN